MVPADKARFVFVRRTDSGEMVGGGLYLYHGAVMDALMPSVSSAAAALAPAYLLAWHSIHFAHARGIRFYNWQPSPPDGGVARFKRQWGSRDVSYAYLTRVTGDVTPILHSTPEAVAAAYRWHYVLPFDRMGAARRLGAGTSSRRDAWNAGGAVGS
jgi:lipid II:glycine glycyltransferase (peptidoglycan interpeptide bridge formation enzyme)